MGVLRRFPAGGCAGPKHTHRTKQCARARAPPHPPKNNKTYSTRLQRHQRHERPQRGVLRRRGRRQPQAGHSVHDEREGGGDRRVEGRRGDYFCGVVRPRAVRSRRRICMEECACGVVWGVWVCGAGRGGGGKLVGRRAGREGRSFKQAASRVEGGRWEGGWAGAGGEERGGDAPVRKTRLSAVNTDMKR